MEASPGLRVKRRAPPALVPLALAALAAGVAVQTERAGAGRARRTDARAAMVPCRDDVRALLAGLREGDAVGDDLVRRIGCVDPRSMVVGLEGPGGGWSAVIVPRGASANAPPVRTERCDLFYREERSPGSGTSSRQRALEALAARLRAHEAVAPPAGW